MVGIMNGKSPDLLYLPNDFLPTNKKKLMKLMEGNFGLSLFISTEPFQRKTLTNHKWKNS
jgi:hypothetical protein